MTWASLLLTDPSPNLRLLVLRELLHRPPDDEEVRELEEIREQDPIVIDLLSLQNADGSFHLKDGSHDGWFNIKTTSQSLLRLGYLGFSSEYPAIRKGVEYLFSHQMEDGSWPIPKTKTEDEMGDTYMMIPLQTGIPLRGLAAAGYATDSRVEKAYEWLLQKSLPDGGWPSGVKDDQYVFPAGYRRLPHTKYGCRTNTSFAVSALALHPQRSMSIECRRGLDLLLAQDTLQASNLGHEIAKIVGVEKDRGFFTYFARYDIAFVLDLCWRIGASLEDERVASMVKFVREQSDEYGLWDYPAYPEVSRWLSFDLLRSLSSIDSDTGWISLEPLSPFQPYPKQPRRY
ncbi:MAG TPA: terpene cyclase/mutase family protein [Dehalococcoidia bacterium]|nr:terpene cyclase/mutase family protein [Dehalococcoidia bacterium]